MLGMILAGGKSVRYGSDKSKIILPGRINDLLTENILLLQSIPEIDEVVISCRKEQTNEMRLRSSCTLIEDVVHTPPIPFCGIIAGLLYAKSSVFVIPCDTPLLNRDFLETLFYSRSSAIHEGKNFYRTVFVRKNGWYIESLIGIYEYSGLPILQKAMDQEYITMFNVFGDNQILVNSSDDSFFVNINTKEDEKLLYKSFL